MNTNNDQKPTIFTAALFAGTPLAILTAGAMAAIILFQYHQRALAVLVVILAGCLAEGPTWGARANLWRWWLGETDRELVERERLLIEGGKENSDESLC